VAELERRIADLKQHAMRIPSLEARISKLEGDLTKAAPGPGPGPDPVPPAAEGSPHTEQVSAKTGRAPARTDNLRAIRGIGKSMEHSLHGLGIRTFEAIAAWTSEDIEKFAALLKLTPQRIRRDRWVQSAQDELKRRTDPPPEQSDR
jgi:predicted flap endonuclease-1-like 5' DNA nuclease